MEAAWQLRWWWIAFEREPSRLCLEAIPQRLLWALSLLHAKGGVKVCDVWKWIPISFVKTELGLSRIRYCYELWLPSSVVGGWRNRERRADERKKKEHSLFPFLTSRPTNSKGLFLPTDPRTVVFLFPEKIDISVALQIYADIYI